MEVHKKLHTPNALSPTEQPGAQNGRGRYAVEKQSLTLAEFEPLFSRCAGGSLVTTLKLLWLHSVCFTFFVVALC